jgi:predicted nucleic acid-binding Zn ribbon protein
MNPDEPSAAAAAALRRVLGTRRAVRRRRAPGRDTASLGPVPVSDAVADLVRERGWEQDAAIAGLMGSWADVVGAELAEHVHPEGFVDGVLALRADSTAWATQVRHLMGHVRSAVDAALGPGVVTRITVAGPTAPSWTAGPRRVPGRGPRDTYG